MIKYSQQNLNLKCFFQKSFVGKYLSENSWKNILTFVENIWSNKLKRKFSKYFNLFKFLSEIFIVKLIWKKYLKISLKKFIWKISLKKFLWKISWKIFLKFILKIYLKNYLKNFVWKILSENFVIFFDLCLKKILKCFLNLSDLVWKFNSEILQTNLSDVRSSAFPGPVQTTSAIYFAVK